MISVVIPVGPHEANKRWLDEALESVKQQTYNGIVQIILIDDGANLNDYVQLGNISIWTYKPPMRLGISHAFNAGVALATFNCVFMLGSDDTLEPTCLERVMQSYNKRAKADGYYSVPIKYMDTSEIQTAPCNAAMVTKEFWRMTGGFPIESAIGAGDSILLSICLAHKLPVYWVGEDTDAPETPLYNYRRHEDIHTYKLTKWWHVVSEIRDICTRDWVPNVDSTRGS